MDDETKEVRIAAARALAEIYRNLPEEYTLRQFEAYFDHSVGVLIVHLDDRDEDIQDAVFGKYKKMFDFDDVCSESCSDKAKSHNAPRKFHSS